MTYDVAIESLATRVPAHWETLPFRRLARLVDVANAGRSAPLLSLASTGVIAPREEFEGLGRQMPADETIERYWLAKPGDLVVNPMWLIGGGIGVSETSGAVSPDYRVYRLGPDLHPRYLHHLLRSQPYRDQYRLYTRAETTFDRRVSKVDFHAMPILVPPLDEQRRIADFLDAETARIDRLVDAISRSSNLLQAKRRALLMSAFPDHSCPVARLGYYLNLVTSGPRGWGDYVGSEGTPFFRSANLRRNEIAPNLDDLAVVDPPQSAAAEAARSRVRIGDVLVGITGANTGWVSLADQRISQSNVSQHVCLVRPGKMIDGRWLAYALSSPRVQELLLGSQYGGTKTQLSLSDIRDLALPIPTVGEQYKIVMAITDGIAAISAERALRDRQRALLAARRQALITAAATGGITV